MEVKGSGGLEVLFFNFHFITAPHPPGSPEPRLDDQEQEQEMNKQNTS